MIHPLRLPSGADFGGRESRAITNREALNRNGLPYLAAALLVLLAWMGYEWTFPVPVFPVDDAYIVIHNAQTLLSGSDPNYAGSSPLTGTTSLVHLALVSGLMLFLGPLAALSASLWIAILLYALGLVRLARVNGAARTASVLVAFLGLIAGETPHQLVNGLETGLMLAAVTWTLTLLPDRKRQPSRLLPVLCGTLPFIRPDLLPLALLILSLQAARHWQARRDLPDFVRRAGLDLAAACLSALPWALWCWSEDGSVFPSTINAKRYYFAQAGWPAGVKAKLVLNGFSSFCADLGLLAVFFAFLASTRLGRAGLTFSVILLLAYFAQFPGALLTYEGRYLFALLPFFLLGAIYALRQTRPVLRIGAAFVMALSLGQSLINAPDFWEQHRSRCYFASHHLAGVAEWCNQHLPAGSTLLIHDAGYIAYGTRFHLVDMVGLKTPGSIPYHQKLTFPSNGENRYQAVSQIALRGHTRFLVVQGRWDSSYATVAGLEASGWDVRLINADYSYKVYALSPPDDASRALQANPTFHPRLISGEGATIK